MFIGKKNALMLVFSMLAGLQISKIYVPDEFERPGFFKLKYVSMEVIGFIAKFAELINYGIEPANFRYLLQILTQNNRIDSQIEVVNKKINGVNTRVYSLKDSKSSQLLPIMIYFHGGGFFMGDLDTYDMYFYELVKKTNIIIISVDYRLSPEHAYPIPTSDGFSVTKYIFENANLFNGDSDKIVLAGDSAGGNIAAVLAQRLFKEKRKLPKLQVLIYPWTQMVDLNLPSSIKYSKTGLMSKYTIAKCIAWYLGYRKVSLELEDLFRLNNHTALLNDDLELKKKVISYLNVDLIPDEYKKPYDYYQNYNQQIYYSNLKQNDINLFRKDKKLVDLAKRTFSDELSPGLADDSVLKGLPKTYFILTEWCSFKDEALIYSERLRRAGVDVKIAFYEKAFHGILTFIDPYFYYSISYKMLDDLVLYIQKNI